MKFTDLSKHLRQLREDRTGRPPTAAMRVMEIWQAALDCQTNGISRILYNEARLPSPLLGSFFRLRQAGQGDIADIYVHKPFPGSNKRRLDPHWKEFVIIKELMHCWSPEKTYVGTPAAAADLLSDLNTPSGPFSMVAKSDHVALLAAAEVILPGAQVRRALHQGKDSTQIGAEHGLHPAVAAYICRHDIIEERIRGSL